MSGGVSAVRRWLQALLALALFVPSSLLAAGGTSIINVNVCSTLFAPVGITTSTPTPTASATASISGTAQPFADLEIKVNGFPVASMVVAGDGSYSANVPLSAGNNQIMAHASDNCGNEADSPTITIVRNVNPPGSPIITSPGNGAVVQTASIGVSGTSEPGAIIALFRNNLLVATTTVDINGNFSTAAGLALGLNTLYATAANAAGVSGPSAPVVISYIPPPSLPPVITQPPYSPPGSTILPAPSPPTIIAPSSGSSTSEASTDVTVASAAGSTVRLYRNGAEVASGITPPDGTLTLNVALEAGPNTIYATATLFNRTSGPSSDVIVTFRPPPPLPPKILNPKDHTTVTRPNVTVSGTATPGLLVRILSNGEQLAKVLVASDGTFSVSVILEEGSNALIATVETEAGESLSVPVNVFYKNPNAGIAGAARFQWNNIGNLAGVVLGVGSVIGETYVRALKSTATSTVLTGVALLAAIFATLVTRGLVGLEELWLLVRTLGRRLIMVFNSGRKVKGTVINRLTGKPIAWALVYTEGTRHYAVSGFRGRFKLKVAEKQVIGARHPGYAMVAASAPVANENAGFVVEMTPQPVVRTWGQWIIDLDLGVLGWAVLGYGWSLSIYLVLNHFSVINALICATLSLTVLLSLHLLVFQQRIKWGRVVDSHGTGYAGLNVNLLAKGSEQLVQSSPTASNGKYTLFAAPGEYNIEVALPSGEKLRQPVTITKHAAYFGFHLRASAG